MGCLKNKNKKALIPLRCPSFSVLVLCAGLLEEESHINNYRTYRRVSFLVKMYLRKTLKQCVEE